MLSKLFSIETKPGAFFRRIDWTAFWRDRKSVV